MPTTVALCRIEHDGAEYNYGEEVPQEVIDAHPEAVGDKPITQSDIQKMTKTELQEALNRLTGNEVTNEDA